MPANFTETLGYGPARTISAPEYRDPEHETDGGPQVTANGRSVLGLAELLLKDPVHVETLARDEARQPDLVPRFLAIALGSFSLFAFALALLLYTAPNAALPTFLASRWAEQPLGSAVGVWLAYTVGFTVATGICLPSFYFYALLAGVKVSWLQVTVLIMKGKASTSILLMGVLPIYVAVVLGLSVFRAPDESLQLALYLGLGLPFLAGLWGVRAIYRGFLGLADTLPPAWRCRRECFLRRLTMACTT